LLPRQAFQLGDKITRGKEKGGLKWGEKRGIPTGKKKKELSGRTPKQRKSAPVINERKQNSIHR